MPGACCQPKQKANVSIVCAAGRQGRGSWQLLRVITQCLLSSCLKACSPIGTISDHVGLRTSYVTAKRPQCLLISEAAIEAESGANMKAILVTHCTCSPWPPKAHWAIPVTQLLWTQPFCPRVPHPPPQHIHPPTHCMNRRIHTSAFHHPMAWTGCLLTPPLSLGNGKNHHKWCILK